MAVGVPENDVFAAADAVLARGERPTVERVRLELGRGSPARVGGLLDQWWARLAERLNGETRLPALPGEVSQAFVAVWQQAIHLAQGVAEQALSEQRKVLAAEREQVVAVENQARQDAVLARQHAVAAKAAQQVSETRLTDLELLLKQRAAQIDDLQDQRSALQQSYGLVRDQLQASQLKLEMLQQQTDQERAAQESYVRGIEERAYREVDRSREEGKSRQVEVRELQCLLTDSRQTLEVCRAALVDCQREAAAHKARAELAEEQGEQEGAALRARAEAAQQMLVEAQRNAIAHQARADTLEAQLAQLRETLQSKRQRTRP
ncbi:MULTISPECIES: DNA-binding protein [Pseudomonas]|uniref:DNA-binding protein n=1 Tax=Pseudomonas TaxID=286 RepID=UPI000D73BAE2|nr:MULTISPECIES: DNA-binding protein [Pseudomonas]AZD99043.1 hypothetical protein C4K12_3177 [Pseudomonas chlororaphis subsp. aureofaciens]AZE23668.1 hypothetical protein C4K08_3241 [Pseudomonas chlororaphis subsp. aureofaciens]PWY37463.1 plasmid replication region [Pseudomonas sp. RW409]